MSLQNLPPSDGTTLSVIGTGADEFLVRFFRSYYNEIMVVRKTFMQGGAVLLDPSQEASRPSDEQLAIAVKQHLESALQKGMMDATKVGGIYLSEIFHGAQYVLAALTDEIFINDLDWSGREYWTSSLLETKLFGTNNAGSTFFKNIDRLLRKDPTIRSELAKIYLLSLKVGFQGRYRGLSGDTTLDDYRRSLFHFVNGREPTLDRNEQQMFSGAYRNVVEPAFERTLPVGRSWIVAFFLFLIVFLVAGDFLWKYESQKIFDVIDQF